MTDNIIDLKDLLKQKDTSMTENYDIASAIKLGVLEVQEAAEGKQALLTILFDKEGDAEVIQAGLLDTMTTVGYLEYIKMELFNTAMHNAVLTDE